MTQAMQQLLPQLNRLSREDRANLAHYLIRSLDEPEDAAGEQAFTQELQQRLDDLESGRDAGYSVEQVLRELRGQA